MYYGYTKKCTNWQKEDMHGWKVRILRVLFFFVPRANPDIEKHFPKVEQWLLEVSEDGWPQREMGLNTNKVVLFCAPNEKNTGLFTDMGAQQLSKTELEPATKHNFEKLWQSNYV